MYLINRNSLGSNLNCLDLTGTFVEVGVLKGDFANEVLSLWKGERAILIDSWEQLQPGTPDVVSTFSQGQHDKNYQHVVNRFANDKRVEVLKSKSLDAVKNFSNLDCVYIDADHSFAGALADIEAWWGTIKEGGLLSGHDYVNAFWGDSQNDPGATWTAVKLAVEKFFSKRDDCSCVISSYSDQTPSWQVFKMQHNVDPKDVLVLSCATDNLTYTKQTEQNHRAYCDAHGYNYKMVREGFWADAHPAWSKLKFLQEELPNYKWVMWVDADAIFFDKTRNLNRFLIPRMGHISSTWHAFGRLQLTNGISFWQNIPWTFDMLKNAINCKSQFAWSGVWEEEGIRRALDADINNYGRWLGIETTHFNSWPHYNAWLQGKDFILHWGGAKFAKNRLIEDSLAMVLHLENDCL
jgi:hypothetical protein